MEFEKPSHPKILEFQKYFLFDIDTGHSNYHMIPKLLYENEIKRIFDKIDKNKY